MRLYIRLAFGRIIRVLIEPNKIYAGVRAALVDFKIVGFGVVFYPCVVVSPDARRVALAGCK